MSQEQDNIELVRKGYEAFANGDMETVMSLFDDNVEWVQPGNSTISGTFHGKGEVAQYMAALGAKTTTVKVRKLLADGDTVVALTEVTTDGQTAHDADVMTISNGKTTRMEIHTDTALMERVYGTKQTASH